MKKKATQKGVRSAWCLSIVIILLSACDTSEPSIIRMGEQECAHCIMIITEEKFASQLVTEQGRRYYFDAIECMAAFKGTEEGIGLDIYQSWVPEYLTGEWLESECAYYLQSDSIRSPMTLNFSAYSTDERARRQNKNTGGAIYGWNDLVEIVWNEWGIEGRSFHE